MGRALSIWLLLTGCYRLAETTPLTEVDREIDGDPVPIDQFCPLLARAYCDGLAPCGCDAGSRPACVARILDDCGGAGRFLGPEAREAVAAGRIRYDAAAAGRILDHVATIDRTCFVYASLDWTMSDLLTFDGMLTGRVEVGGRCTLAWDDVRANECAGGVCEDGRCRAVATVGEPCPGDTLCIEADRPLILESDFDGIEARCVSGTCAARLGLEASCRRDADCASHVCDSGRCAGPRAGNAFCVEDQACASGACTERSCAPAGGRLGEPCQNDDACMSLTCEDGLCAQPICNGYGVVSD